MVQQSELHSKVNESLRDKLTEILSAGVTDEAMKKITKAADEVRERIEDDVMYRLKDDLAPNLVAYVAEMAGSAVAAMLEGNEEQMRRYLGCQNGGWNGRSDGEGNWGRRRELHEWHSVIHGKLFEQGALELRKKLVEAHAGLIRNERILDLEDQVAALVAQVNKLKTEKEGLQERLRSVA